MWASGFPRADRLDPGRSSPGLDFGLKASSHRADWYDRFLLHGSRSRTTQPCLRAKRRLVGCEVVGAKFPKCVGVDDRRVGSDNVAGGVLVVLDLGAEDSVRTGIVESGILLA